MEASEVGRYEEYDAKHGARYVQMDPADEPMEEDDWSQ